MKELEWNVFYVNISTDEISVLNVFDHSRFRSDAEKYLKKCKTKEELANELRSSLMCCYWSKFEWEILLSPLNQREQDKAKKIDVFRQVEINWNAFMDYMWNVKMGK